MIAGGKADWSCIADLAARLRVPVFGSGDVFEPADAARMVAETACAGVMIARGAMGDPFIFRRARSAMTGFADVPISLAERVEAARRHLELSAGFLGERTACVEFRKQFCSYTKGAIGGAELRAAGVKASTIAEFGELFSRWLLGKAY